MARLMLPFDMRGAVLAGASLLLAGCAQDPGGSTNPDNCILICALVRSLTGEPAPPAPQPVATPQKKPARAAAPHPPAPLAQRSPPQPPVALRQPPPTPVAQRSPSKPDVRKVARTRTMRRLPASVATTVQPRSAEASSPPSLAVQLPGSVPIAAVTSHFVPNAASTP